MSWSRNGISQILNTASKPENPSAVSVPTKFIIGTMFQINNTRIIVTVSMTDNIKLLENMK